MEHIGCVCYNKYLRCSKGEDGMKRYHILDEIRGITLCSMILYHTVWDLVYLFGYDWNWYRSDFAYLWQQSICWCFILLSGFCFSMGKKKWRRGLIVFGAGALVSLVTHIAMPGQSIRFGVLTMLGSSMLLMALLEKFMRFFLKSRKGEYRYPVSGMLISFLLFFCTRGINEQYLGFESIRLYELPVVLYQKGELMTYIGFMSEDFYSTDYFSLIPWFFLFSTGYFLYYAVKQKGWMEKLSFMKLFPQFVSDSIFSSGLRFMGKNSLIIYMLHQPVIYVLLSVLDLIPLY